MNLQHCLATALALAVVAGAPPSFAQTAGDNADPAYFVTAEDKWSFEITPYAWLAGIKADVTVRDHTVTVDQSFNDILKSIKFAAAGLAIARYQNWLVWTQVDYFSLSTDQLDNPPARGSLDSKDTIYTLAGGYRFNGWTDRQTFDVLIGVQGLHIDNTLTLHQIGRTRAYPLVAAGGSTLVLTPHALRRSATCQTAQVSDAVLRHYPKAPYTDIRVFLLGVVGIFFLLLCSVFLGMAALFRDLRTRP